MRFLIGLAVGAVCANANAAYSAFGIGELSCGKYISEITSSENSKAAYGWWLAGFVTGTNLAKNRIVTTDVAGYEAWIKKYCVEHPLDNFQRGIIELDKELDGRKQ